MDLKDFVALIPKPPCPDHPEVIRLNLINAEDGATCGFGIVKRLKSDVEKYFQPTFLNALQRPPSFSTVLKHHDKLHIDIDVDYIDKKTRIPATKRDACFAVLLELLLQLLVVSKDDVKLWTRNYGEQGGIHVRILNHYSTFSQLETILGVLETRFNFPGFKIDTKVTGWCLDGCGKFPQNVYSPVSGKLFEEFQFPWCGSSCRRKCRLLQARSDFFCAQLSEKMTVGVTSDRETEEEEGEENETEESRGLFFTDILMSYIPNEDALLETLVEHPEKIQLQACRYFIAVNPTNTPKPPFLDQRAHILAKMLPKLTRVEAIRNLVYMFVRINAKIHLESSSPVHHSWINTDYLAHIVDDFLITKDRMQLTERLSIATPIQFEDGKYKMWFLGHGWEEVNRLSLNTVYVEPLVRHVNQLIREFEDLNEKSGDTRKTIEDSDSDDSQQPPAKKRDTGISKKKFFFLSNKDILGVEAFVWKPQNRQREISHVVTTFDRYMFDTKNFTFFLVGPSEDEYAASSLSLNKSDFENMNKEKTMEKLRDDHRIFNTRPSKTDPVDFAIHFLNTVMGYDVQLFKYTIEILHKIFTGNGAKHLVYCLGNSNNGKTTFSKLLLWLAGSYGGMINGYSLSVAASRAATQPDLVKNSKNLITCLDETDQKTLFSSMLVKLVTSGGESSARTLFGKPETIYSRGSLWVMSNTVPNIVVDRAILDRLSILQFNVTFDQIKRSFKANRDSILNQNLGSRINFTREDYDVLVRGLGEIIYCSEYNNVSESDEVKEIKINLIRRDNMVSDFMKKSNIVYCQNSSISQHDLEDLFNNYSLSFSSTSYVNLEELKQDFYTQHPLTKDKKLQGFVVKIV